MLDEVTKSLKPITSELLEHRLFEHIERPDNLRTFMEHHVFAVWDSMSLLKALQERFTRTSSPWFPVGNPEIRYLINELVVTEETDLDINGNRQSHFEMYLEAMTQCGANRKNIDDFLEQVTHGTDIFLIIASSDLPITVKQFLKNTFDLISEGKPHKIAAAFTFGRKGLIPEMFSSIINSVQQKFPGEDLSLLEYYFDRHIEPDADEHSSMAYKMLEALCDDDEFKWKEVQETAITCLESRKKLWDGIKEEVSREYAY